jgi:23S rRNA pseudouridine1911/1915/1917 synthase
LMVDRVIHLVPQEADRRVDVYVSNACKEFTRSFVQKLIGDGNVTINGQVAKASQKVRSGDTIIVSVPPPEPSPILVPQLIPLIVIYEDGDVMVIDKPAGMTVYPAPGHPDRTIMNAVLAHSPEIGRIDGSVRPGVVHRLDKDTSGVMVIAKHKQAHLSLAAQLKARTVLKKYLVLVKGCPETREGLVSAPIGRHPKDRKRMTVIEGGREARTRYRVVKVLGGCSLIEATLETGRTHQIRVHFSRMGWPVVADSVYGVRVPWLKRQFVHASRLGFRLPSSDRWVEFSAALPADLEDALKHASRP